MVFTFFILRTRYNWRHLVGVLACLAGLAVLVYSDALANSAKSTAGASPLFGDILCLVGALLYAISNTGQEITVKKWDRHEFLAMIGLFGAPISITQLLILERKELLDVGWNFPIMAMIVGFALILFAMYSLTPHMMVLSGSTLFNLSLLTSDAYAILFGIFLFNDHLHWLYWIALVIIVAGLCLYNIRNEPAQSDYDRPLIDRRLSGGAEEDLEGKQLNLNTAVPSTGEAEPLESPSEDAPVQLDNDETEEDASE